MRAKNTYRLGYYDKVGTLGLAGPGMLVSEFEFPLQEVSRVLYAEKISLFLAKQGYKNLVCPKKFLFVLPGFEKTPLDDKHLFIVVDKVSFEPSLQNQLLFNLKAAYKKYITEGQRDLSDSYQLLLDNLFKTVLAAGLWNVSLNSQNTVLLLSETGDPVLAFLDLERPPLGAANPMKFFHEDQDECLLNGRLGMASLIQVLTEECSEVK